MKWKKSRCNLVFKCWVTIFWEKAAHSVGLLSSLCFVYLWFWLFPIWVLRAGFVFWLLQFLFIAFSLLLTKREHVFLPCIIFAAFCSKFVLVEFIFGFNVVYVWQSDCTGWIKEIFIAHRDWESDILFSWFTTKLYERLTTCARIYLSFEAEFLMRTDAKIVSSFIPFAFKGSFVAAGFNQNPRSGSDFRWFLAMSERFKNAEFCSVCWILQKCSSGIKFSWF